MATTDSTTATGSPINLLSTYGGPSDKDPLTVPNRNTSSSIVSSPTSGNFNGLFTPTTNNFTSDTDVLSPTTSKSSSFQLPAGSGAVAGDGTPAGSLTSTTASSQFASAEGVQQATGQYQFSGSFDPNTGEPIYTAGGVPSTLGVAPAQPLTAADLQSPSNVFNNAFATLSGPGTSVTNNFNTNSLNSDQWDRVKLRFAPAHPLASYPAGTMLYPLAATTGLVWLYKPSVSISSNVEYETMNLTHSISEVHSFMSNRAPTITVSGPVISQTIDDAMYALACIHFLQSVSKMAFGNTGLSNTQTLNTLGASATVPTGSPPPVLLFSGYGQAMFNDLPVIVTSFGLDLPPDVDYIEVPTGPGVGTKIPVSFMLQVSLTVQRSTANMRSFNLDTFSRYGIKSWW